MIVISLIDGLTVGENLYESGQVFTLPDGLKADREGRKKQKRILRSELFRKASADEMLSGLQKEEITEEELDSEEKAQVKELIKSMAQAKLNRNEEVLDGLLEDLE